MDTLSSGYPRIPINLALPSGRIKSEDISLYGKKNSGALFPWPAEGE
jgi:hypothetical protein